MQTHCSSVFCILTSLSTAITALPTASLAAQLSVPAQYPTITDAINASSAGDSILVAPGTYAEAIVFPTHELTIMSTSGAVSTIIDAPLGSGLIPTPNAAVTFPAGSNGTVQGFTITGGTGNPDGLGSKLSFGGGVHVLGSARILDCSIINNTATDGAGIYIDQTALAAEIDGCTVRGNDARNDGGGIAVDFNLGSGISVNNTRILSNSADNVGGGLYLECDSVSVTDSLIQLNEAQRGAGAYVIDPVESGFPGAIRFDRCTFLDNTASVNGSAILVSASAQEIFADGCRFIENTALNRGTVYAFEADLIVSNSIIAGNTAEEFVAAFHTDNTQSTSIALDHTLIYANQNTIFTALADGEVFASNSMYFENGLLSSSGLAGGSVILPADTLAQLELFFGPIFADLTGPDGVLGTTDDDPTLIPGSFAIDAGDTSVGTYLGTTDLLGNPRLVDDPSTVNTGLSVYGVTVDIGPAEYQPPASPPSADLTTTGATLQGQPGFGIPDGTVDLDDLGFFLSIWLGI
ncbi:MAG: hypothetical protein AAGB51_10890 [Planctomycetota bacterium]